MTPDILDTSSPKEVEQNLSVQRALLKRAEKVAKSEDIKLEVLPKKYEKYYGILRTDTYDRCVDGRAVLQFFDENQQKPTGHTPDNYKGAQFAGASGGFVDAVRKVTGLDEEPARTAVELAYESHGATIGMHKDDKHGELNSKEKLSEREKGCGDHDSKVNGNVDMTRLDEETRRKRQEWAEEKGELVYLTGEHNEQLAAMNFVPGTAFDTSRAVNQEDPESIFNGDIYEAYKRAGWVYDQIDTELDKEEFQMQVAEAVMLNYMQTAKALVPGFDTMHVHTNVSEI